MVKYVKYNIILTLVLTFLTITILFLPLPLVSSSDELNVTVTTDKSNYKQRDIVIISGNVTYEGNLVNDGFVAIEVRDPKKTMLTRTLPLSTNSSENFYIEVKELYPCDDTATPVSAVERGERKYIYVLLKVRNNAIIDKEVYITISIVDKNFIPLAFYMENKIIMAGTTLVSMPKLDLPNWASLGTAYIYANVYTNLPSNGGRPLCPEACSQLTIVESFYVDPLPENNTSQQTTENGTYQMKMRLPPDTLPGTYVIDAVAWYEGSKCSASTIFFTEVVPSPPWPAFAIKPPVAGPNYTITFDASPSSPEGYNDTITNYYWDFGDGTKATGIRVQHSYLHLGNYTVTLNVTDSEGFSNITSKTVNIAIIHDIAALKIDCITTIYDNWIVYVKVTVKNKGTIPENFNLTLYCNNTQVLQELINLDIQQTAELTLEWNTTGIEILSHYFLKVQLDVLENETNIEDNLIVFGPINVFKLGDVNGDRVIDIYDVTSVCVTYGRSEQDSNWIVLTDLVRDGIIDIYDVVTVCVLYGLEY